MHQGGIHAICIQEGKLLASGSKDCLLKIYDTETFEEEKSFKLKSCARSIDLKDGKIIVGTKNGQIMHFNVEDNSEITVMEGHSIGEAWGLAIDSEGHVITSGDDN